jgi:hypothetical protein
MYRGWKKYQTTGPKGEIQREICRNKLKNATISAFIFIHSVIVYKCIDYRVTLCCIEYSFLANLGHLIFSKYFINLKGYLTEMNGYHCFNSSVDPERPKNVKFSLWPIIATSRGGAYDVLGEVQKFSGEVPNYFRGGAHLKIRLWKADLQCT